MSAKDRPKIKMAGGKWEAEYPTGIRHIDEQYEREHPELFTDSPDIPPAAARELLEACKAVLSFWEMNDRRNYEPAMGDRLREAIRKAEEV